MSERMHKRIDALQNWLWPLAWPELVRDALTGMVLALAVCTALSALMLMAVLLS